tara:strand:- start:1086 stop:1271 length:186 start_codon:yes stop_codon:yes gene_type:complete
MKHNPNNNEEPQLVLTDVILENRMLKNGFTQSYVDYMIARIKEDREKHSQNNIIKMHTEGR